MKYLTMVLALLFFSSVTSFGQKDMYVTHGGELLFQFSQTEINGESVNDLMRFTCFFHFGNYLNYDFSQKAGLFTGLAVRNIGYIHQEYNDEQGLIKIKRRSYSLGLPLALKFGNMKKIFLFAGGEYEWLFAYKEKHFVGDVKSKFTDWFSNRTPHFIPSVFAGIQFPMGVNIKIKYYLQNFMNKSYRSFDGRYPYANEDVRIFYISLSFNLLRWEMPGFSSPDKKVDYFTQR